jgi:hypothetical protein
VKWDGYRVIARKDGERARLTWPMVFVGAWRDSAHGIGPRPSRASIRVRILPRVEVESIHTIASNRPNDRQAQAEGKPGFVVNAPTNDVFMIILCLPT